MSILSLLPLLYKGVLQDGLHSERAWVLSTPGEVDVCFASDRVARKRSGANMRMDAHLSDEEAKKRLPSARA